jgi:hypothetical protein
MADCLERGGYFLRNYLAVFAVSRVDDFVPRCASFVPWIFCEQLVVGNPRRNKR